MDGLARMTAFSAQDRIDTQRQRDDEAFRAWHRQPDAVPDPIESEDRKARTTTLLRRFVARLVAA